VSFSSLIDRVALVLGQQVVDVPVGFKHSTKEMLKSGTLMAAEESGGFGFGFHLPERDALLALIIVLSAMAQRKAQLRELREHIAERFGHPYFLREDVQLTSTTQEEDVRQRVTMLRGEPELAGMQADRISELDGLKIIFPEGFLLLRFSGTEPLLRIYCEHQVENREKEVVRRVRDFLFQT
jgi:phosphomannomutase